MIDEIEFVFSKPDPKSTAKRVHVWIDDVGTIHADEESGPEWTIGKLAISPTGLLRLYLYDGLSSEIFCTENVEDHDNTIAVEYRS
jgi:hypothetical protein